MIPVEVSVDSAVSARAAQAGGAARVELCGTLHDGGTTPSAGMIAGVRRQISIGLVVLIRPRGGDFLYSAEELDTMEHDIGTAKALGADGIAVGVLTPRGRADQGRLERLVAAARPMTVTFHRAFDVCADPLRTLDDLCALGIDAILTSGQQPTALEGAGLIAETARRAAGRCRVIAAGGISARTAREVARRSGAAELHVGSAAGLPLFEGAAGLFECRRLVVDAGRVRELVQAANG